MERLILQPGGSNSFKSVELQANKISEEFSIWPSRLTLDSWVWLPSQCMKQTGVLLWISHVHQLVMRNLVLHILFKYMTALVPQHIVYNNIFAPNSVFYCQVPLRLHHHKSAEHFFVKPASLTQSTKERRWISFLRIRKEHPALWGKWT